MSPDGPLHLFVLSPPYSGSTVLEQLLATSPAVTALPSEGQFVDGVAQWLRDRPWDSTVERPWPAIRARWEELWDADAPVRLEKSPPNISRAHELEEHFAPAAFVVLLRDPYATAEGLERRRGSPPMDAVDDSWATTDALAHAAGQWLRFARFQVENLAILGRTCLVAYEELVADPAAVAARLVAFEPRLVGLDAGAEFTSHSARGTGTRRLQDFNAEKLARLGPDELAAVTEVLAPERDLLASFGYPLRDADGAPVDERPWWRRAAERLRP